VKQEQQKRVELEKNMSEKLDAIQQQLLLAQQQQVLILTHFNPFGSADEIFCSQSSAEQAAAKAQNSLREVDQTNLALARTLARYEASGAKESALSRQEELEEWNEKLRQMTAERDEARDEARELGTEYRQEVISLSLFIIPCHVYSKLIIIFGAD
jgi:flagellar biosynthesis regulator FlaF